MNVGPPIANFRLTLGRRRPSRTCDYALGVTAIKILRDEYDFASAVVIRPALEPNQIMPKMLSALDLPANDGLEPQSPGGAK